MSRLELSACLIMLLSDILSFVLSPIFSSPGVLCPASFLTCPVLSCYVLSYPIPFRSIFILLNSVLCVLHYDDINDQHF